MTDDERKAEQAKSLASAVYRQLDEAAHAEDYVRTITAKWGEHPAFKTYMSEMLLTVRLAEFLGRPRMTHS